MSSKKDDTLRTAAKIEISSASEAAKIRAEIHRDNLEKGFWGATARKILKDWRLYVMIAPILLVFLLWRYLPLYDLIVAFKKDDPTLPLNEELFVGFNNFRQLISGSAAKEFWQAFRNTFLLSFYGLLFGFPVPIILALMFSEIKSDLYRSILQIITYLPKFVSLVVMTTLIQLLLQGSLGNILEPGMLAQMFYKLGIISKTVLHDGMLRQPQYFRAIYQISGIWETAGYGSIVFFAAIIGIPPSAYEAAKMDGSNKLAQIRYVVLPGILSTVVIMLILQIGQLLTIGYEKVLLLYNDKIYVTADVVSTFVLRTANMIASSGEPNQGLASAADLINAVLSMVLVIGANVISRKAADTSLF